MFARTRHPAGADAPTRGRIIRWARFYDPLVAVATLGRAPAMREQAADLAALRPGESVLDVGCGTGELTQRARARVGPPGRVCGIDPSADMIAVAREKSARAGLGIEYRVAAIEHLPFPDASFDVVLSSLMMHHLPEDLKLIGLGEVRRVLEPDGRLLIVDLKRGSGLLHRLTPPMLIHHDLSYGVQDLTPVVSAAGFTDIQTGDTRFRTLGFVSARAPT
jgi:demethylmenaquinone methyltransferase/2-methoxy-6-polyprenyl-1,4-benzoquinol methylase/phosphoethanolamine N-methyltransferase